MSPSSVSLLFLLLVLHLLLGGVYGARLGKIKFGMIPSSASTSSSNDHRHTNLIMENNHVMKKNDNIMRNNDDKDKDDMRKEVKVVRVARKDEDDCTPKGKSCRNLGTSTPMSTFLPQPIQKNNVEKTGAKDESMMSMELMKLRGCNKRRNIMSSSSSSNDDEEVGHDQKYDHQELTDMTEMDYSSASRKPPIHN